MVCVCQCHVADRQVDMQSLFGPNEEDRFGEERMIWRLNVQTETWNELIMIPTTSNAEPRVHKTVEENWNHMYCGRME